MSRDDRDHWREQDYQREQRDREFWRDYDRRRDYERQDREDEARRRAEASERAHRAIRDGDTVEALRNAAGPEAVISYLQATGGDRAAPGKQRLWTRHAFVTELSELVENVEEAPATVTFTANEPDSDGDVPVRAAAGQRTERFWVRKQLLPTLSLLSPAPPRTRALIREIVAQRPPSPFLTGLAGGLFGVPSTEPAAVRPRRTPHVIVTSLRELVENVRALPHGELTPRRIDGDGDAVVVARFGLTTETFWVKAALLEQLAPLTDALPETMRLIQALGRMRAGAGD